MCVKLVEPSNVINHEVALIEYGSTLAVSQINGLSISMIQVQEPSLGNSGIKTPKPVPVAALVIYEDGNQETIGCTRHEIKNNIMQSGDFVSPEQARACFNIKSQSLGLLPENILASDNTQLLWYVKARQAPMWFRIAKSSRRLMVWWPTLLFHTRRDGQFNRLSVFALGNQKRPTADTPLFHAPLMNIGVCGDLCQGSATLPKSISLANLHEVEATIYESNFTHVNHQQTLRKKGNVSTHDQLAFWKAKAKDGTKIRQSELVATNRTIADLLR
ncbi:MAG: hypothetical protein GJ680_19120 [Alteromonadaceae bacterium]|nr:hypothetical protein [Alteromonadaceae bacterium]